MDIQCTQQIYLDNASTTFPKPKSVPEAMFRYMTDIGANPGRGGYCMVTRAQLIAVETRAKLAKLIGATEDRRVIYTASCTDSLNMAIKGVLNPGDHVVTTMLEHNSVSRPLESLHQAGVIELTRVGFSDVGLVDPKDIEAAITPKTRMIALTHASNVVGTIQRAEEVSEIAQRHGLLFLLDAAQTIGLMDIDVQAMHIDLLAFPVHKAIFGPAGLGVLYVSERVEVRPWREGGTGLDSTNPVQPSELPDRLEAGTFNGVGIAGLHAALDVLTPAKTLEHERVLTQIVFEKLANEPGVRIFGDPEAKHRVGTVAIDVEGLTSGEVAGLLDERYGIATRAGLHCSPYAHRGLGTYPDGLVRLAPGPFNTEAEMLQTCEAICTLSREVRSGKIKTGEVPRGRETC